MLRRGRAPRVDISCRNTIVRNRGLFDSVSELCVDCRNIGVLLERVRRKCDRRNIHLKRQKHLNKTKQTSKHRRVDIKWRRRSNACSRDTFLIVVFVRKGALMAATSECCGSQTPKQVTVIKHSVYRSYNTRTVSLFTFRSLPVKSHVKVTDRHLAPDSSLGEPSTSRQSIIVRPHLGKHGY